MEATEPKPLAKVDTKICKSISNYQLRNFFPVSSVYIDQKLTSFAQFKKD